MVLQNLKEMLSKHAIASVLLTAEQVKLLLASNHTKPIVNTSNLFFGWTSILKSKYVRAHTRIWAHIHTKASRNQINLKAPTWKSIFMRPHSSSQQHSLEQVNQEFSVYKFRFLLDLVWKITTETEGKSCR